MRSSIPASMAGRLGPLAGSGASADASAGTVRGSRRKELLCSRLPHGPGCLRNAAGDEFRCLLTESVGTDSEES